MRNKNNQYSGTFEAITFRWWLSYLTPKKRGRASNVKESLEKEVFKIIIKWRSLNESIVTNEDKLNQAGSNQAELYVPGTTVPETTV